MFVLSLLQRNMLKSVKFCFENGNHFIVLTSKSLEIKTFGLGSRIRDVLESQPATTYLHADIVATQYAQICQILY